jgi:chromosome partitioning protein
MSGKSKVDAPVASVLNMKGGVGKTTIAAHIFRELYLQHKKKILLIDFDPQFNLTQTLLKEATYEKLKLERKTILSVLEDPASFSIYKTSAAAAHPPAASEIVGTMKFLKDSDGKLLARLDLLAGDFSLVKYSLVDDKGLLADAKRRFDEFISAARKEYDLVCIDCNPSSSFLTTCSLRASTHVIIPVRPDRYSMLGLRLLDEFLDGMIGLPVKPKKIIVLNGVVTTGYDPTVENELRSDPVYGPLTMTTHLAITRLLEARPTYTGFATDRRVSHSTALKKRIRSLSVELVAALGLK